MLYIYSAMKTTPPILELPTELVQHVSSFLSKSQQAALALTCRGLYLTALDGTWDALRARLARKETCKNPPLYMAPDEQARWELLALLGRDLHETHMLCHFCRILHPTTIPERKGCIWNEATGPKWWDLARLTFNDVCQAANEYHEAPHRGRVPIPGLSIATDWRRHPGDIIVDGNTSGEFIQCPQRHIKLETTVEGVYNSILTYLSTQRLRISSVPKAPDSNNPKTLISYVRDLFSPEPTPPTPYANHGFQICKHQSTYAPLQDPTSEYEWIFRRDPDLRDPGLRIKCVIDDLIEAHWLHINEFPVPRDHKASRMIITAAKTSSAPASEDSPAPPSRSLLQGQLDSTEFHLSANLESEPLAEIDSAAIPGSRLTSSTWTCTSCPTTATLNTVKYPGGQGIEFVLGVSQWLGCCNAPDCESWEKCWGIDKIHCRRRRGWKGTTGVTKNPDIDYTPSIKIPLCFSVALEPSCAHNDWDQPSCCGFSFSDGYLVTIMAFTDENRHKVKARSDHADDNLPIFEDHFCPGKNCGITSPGHEKSIDNSISAWEMRRFTGCRLRLPAGSCERVLTHFRSTPRVHRNALNTENCERG